MRLDLFGIGTKSDSWAVTAQRRINCLLEMRKEQDRTRYVIQARQGLVNFVTTIGGNTSRGMWAVNTLASPALFTVHGNTLYLISNAGVVTIVGTIGTSSGDVSMADDGRYLVLVDGQAGYYYNMLAPAGLNQIVDPNFTTSPKTVTWQDTYFIVTSGLTNQFQLSQNADPTTWPALQIGFTGSAPGALQAGIADHAALNLFGDAYTEFMQDTGSPDMPYVPIPGSAQQFGLAAPWSLSKFDNSVAGIFKDRQGGIIAARLQGFSLRRISDHDIEALLAAMPAVGDARGFAINASGHPVYLANFPTGAQTLVYDGLAQAWSEWQAPDGSRFWGDKAAYFVNRTVVSDRRNGNIYQLSSNAYDDAGTVFPVELWSKHIWQDDKYIGIESLQVDVESGAGTATGQGANPVFDLQVSKDGGNSFFSVGFSSIGKIGEFTQRVMWRSLGAARDWVLKLRITDPARRFITGASAQVTVAPG